MDLRQLRYFVAVAEAPSIAKAAEWLHITQPALSVQISQLEAELGLPLVTRSNRGIELTANGQKLYDHAKQMLEYHREAMVALKQGTGSAYGKVSLGLPSSLAGVIAPQLYCAMRSRLPGVELYVIECSTAALFEWLQTGKLDLAVLFNVPDDVGFDVTPLYTEDFCLVGIPEAGTGDTVSFEELTDYRLIIPSKATSWRKLLDSAAAEHDRQLYAPLETESVNVLKSVALSGEAFAIIPRLSVQEEICAGKLQARRIINPAMYGTKSMVTLKNELLDDTQKRVRDLIIELTQARALQSDLELQAVEKDPLRRVLPSSLFPVGGGRPSQNRGLFTSQRAR